MKFTKKDLFFSVVTGLYAGAILWKVFNFLNVSTAWLYIFKFWTQYPSWQILIIIIPVLWVLGVNFGYFLGRWLPFFNQFGRFTAVGFTNFAIYTGVLNLLIALSSINSGFGYTGFVTIAFIVGVVHSFILNKYWVFESNISSGSGAEFGKFLTVSMTAGLINVAIASFIVNFIPSMWNISSNGWANIGAIVGSATALVFSFIGFRMIVFKNKNAVP